MALVENNNANFRNSDIFYLREMIGVHTFPITLKPAPIPNLSYSAETFQLRMQCITQLFIHHISLFTIPPLFNKKSPLSTPQSLRLTSLVYSTRAYCMDSPRHGHGTLYLDPWLNEHRSLAHFEPYRLI